MKTDLKAVTPNKEVQRLQLFCFVNNWLFCQCESYLLIRRCGKRAEWAELICTPAHSAHKSPQLPCDLRRLDSVRYVVIFPRHSSSGTLCGQMWKQESNTRGIAIHSRATSGRDELESQAPRLRKRAACTRNNSHTSGSAPAVTKTSPHTEGD